MLFRSHITQIVTGVGQQSQGVREEAKQHLNCYVGNVERYTDRKGFTESRWQMMRMPRTGVSMVVVVRIFSSRMTSRIAAVAVMIVRV